MNGEIASFLRGVYYTARKMLFTEAKPDGPFMVVDADKDDINQILGAYCFGPNWHISYHFRGEIINLSRVHYNYHKDIEWWQVHVRGWTGNDGMMYLRAHYEPEPTEHPSEHLEGIGYDIQAGMAELEGVLTQSDVSIIRHES